MDFATEYSWIRGGTVLFFEVRVVFHQPAHWKYYSNTHAGLLAGNSAYF